MERTVKCFKFQSMRLIKFIAVFTVVYIAASILTLLIFSLTRTGTTNMSYCFAAIIFAFIAPCTLYKSTFNNLLIFGNTRKDISYSFILCGITFSALFAVLSELSELLNYGLSHVFKSVRSTGLEYIFKGLNPPKELLLFFTLFLMVIMAGYAYSALCYRFGKIFRIIFWCSLGTALTLTSIPSETIQNSFNFYKFTNGLGSIFVYWCSLLFLVAAVILGVVLFLVARRQPQNT